MLWDECSHHELKIMPFSSDGRFSPLSQPSGLCTLSTFCPKWLFLYTIGIACVLYGSISPESWHKQGGRRWQNSLHGAIKACRGIKPPTFPCHHWWHHSPTEEQQPKVSKSTKGVKYRCGDGRQREQLKTPCPPVQRDKEQGSNMEPHQRHLPFLHSLRFLSGDGAAFKSPPPLKSLLIWSLQNTDGFIHQIL